MDNQAASPDMGGASAIDTGAPIDDKPFDNEPFDAGVEANEDTDPKKYIEQLTGKLGQSLRKYNDQQGHPDFELEKFAINSLLSATHTAEMSEEDKNDIIKKVNTAGDDGGEPRNSEEMNNPDTDNDMGSEEPNMDKPVDDGLNESDDLFIEAKKCSMFAPKGSPEYMEENELTENLDKSKKNSIFNKKVLKEKLQKTFIKEDMTMTEPTIKPLIKPITKPEITPSRRNKPFTIEPDTVPETRPKAEN